MAENNLPNLTENQSEKRKSYKLSAEAKVFVLKMLALNMPSRWIAEEVGRKYGIDISERAIRDKSRRKKPAAAIQKYRAEFEASIARIPAADKLHRLSVATQLIRQGLLGYKTDRLTKLGTVETLLIRDPYLAAKGVELAQKELGTDKDRSRDKAISEGGFNFNNIVQFFEDMSDDDRSRLDFEWDALGIGNGSGKGPRSRF